MSRIQESNYFDISHNLIEYRDSKWEYHYLLHNLNASELKVYLTLCHFANRFHRNRDKNKNRFYMDDIRLGEVTGLSPRQLIRARKTLRKLGLIKTYKRVGLALDYEIISLGQKWRNDMSKKALQCDKGGLPI